MAMIATILGTVAILRILMIPTTEPEVRIPQVGPVCGDYSN